MLPGIQLNQKGRKSCKEEDKKVKRKPPLGRSAPCSSRSWKWFCYSASAAAPRRTNPALNSHVRRGESRLLAFTLDLRFAMDQHVVYTGWDPQVLGTASSFSRGSCDKSPKMKARCLPPPGWIGPISAYFALGKKKTRKPLERCYRSTWVYSSNWGSLRRSDHRITLVFSNTKEVSINIRKARAAASAYIAQSSSTFIYFCNEGGRKAKGKQTFWDHSYSAAALQPAPSTVGLMHQALQQKSEQGPHQLAVKDHR